MRPQVWLVTAAWKRYAVTDLATRQWQHLAHELQPEGVDVHAVVVADDDNLDIARGNGCHTIERDNDHGLGNRFNAGFKYAAAQGADYFIYLGSDDWVHRDLVMPLPDPMTITTGRRIAFVNVTTGRLQVCHVNGTWGVIPWVIPAGLLRRGDFNAIEPERHRLTDRNLASTLRRRGVPHRWDFKDPHDLCRVDFKTDANLNKYGDIVAKTAQDMPERDAWPLLAEFYPSGLVNEAQALMETV